MEKFQDLATPFSQQSGLLQRHRRSWLAEKTNRWSANEHTVRIKDKDLQGTTKYATIILVAKILERNGKTLDEKIYKYLPSNWNPDVNFKNLSFFFSTLST